MLDKKEIEGLFDRVSSTYDTIGPRFFTYFGDKLVKFADLRADASVLDIATGRGAILFAAAQTTPLKRIVGIDISDQMVMQTKKDIANKSLNNVEILRMDAENLDFPDGSFDYVFCGFALFFFPEPKRALMEIYRVLKTGGFLYISTWAKTEERRKWLIDLVKEQLPEEADFNDAFRFLPTKSFETEEQVAAALCKACFTTNKSAMESMEVTYESAQQWWDAQYSHGIRSVFEIIEKKNGQDGLLRFKQNVFKAFDSMKINGAFSVPMKAIFVGAKKPV
jgi:ubiquinone/menaquinone biosynthesis C-methylase UbiE